MTQHLKINLGRATRKTFSCGEMYVRFDESFREQHVFLVQTGRTGYMNEDMIELLLMIQAAKLNFAREISVVMPYFPYARQDKMHGPREGISARLFADMIISAGATSFITMHLHADQIQGFFNCPVDNLHPRRMFIEYFAKKELTNPVIVSPDVGSAKSAKKIADNLGMPLVIIHKNRPAHNMSEVIHVMGEIEGKTPIIVDDMVDTAGSVLGATKALRQNGAREEMYLCATHAVFSGNARENLNQVGFQEIVTTDTLPIPDPPRNLKILSVAPLFANVAQYIAEHKSVSPLYL